MPPRRNSYHEESAIDRAARWWVAFTAGWFRRLCDANVCASPASAL